MPISIDMDEPQYVHMNPIIYNQIEEYAISQRLPSPIMFTNNIPIATRPINDSPYIPLIPIVFPGPSINE